MDNERAKGATEALPSSPLLARSLARSSRLPIFIIISHLPASHDLAGFIIILGAHNSSAARRVRPRE